MCTIETNIFSTPMDISNMRIKCPECNEKATVYSRATVTDEVNTVYARCKNTQCKKYQCGFAATVSFSHWIDPKVASVQLAFTTMFEHLPPNEKKNMLKSLENQL